jgi:hypothetical protein
MAVPKAKDYVVLALSSILETTDGDTRARLALVYDC